MKCFLGPDGRHDDRCGPFLAKDFDGHVDIADIHQAARADEVFLEGLPVRAESRIVVDPRGEVTPMGSWNISAGSGLEVEYVDGVRGRTDALCGVTEVHPRESTVKRTARQESQKVSPAAHRDIHIRLR